MASRWFFVDLRSFVPERDEDGRAEEDETGNHAGFPRFGDANVH